MTARQQRRREERKTRKEANKAENKTTAAERELALDGSPDGCPAPIAFEPPRSRAEINRANARDEAAPFSDRFSAEPKIQGKSTGPRTPEGKAISSMNNFRHGLAGNFAVLDWEDSDRYGELLFQLHQEHQPETMTEYILVERMAQHQWLSQRALHLQNLCFSMDAPLCDAEKQLALYLRYGTTHDRAFHKCLADLLKLRVQKSNEQRGFESQKRQKAAETRKQEVHEAKLAAVKTRKPDVKTPTASPTAAECTISQLQTMWKREESGLPSPTRAA